MGTKNGTIKNMTYEQWVAQEQMSPADEAGDADSSFNPATALTDVKKQLDDLKNTNYAANANGVGSVPDALVGASGIGASGANTPGNAANANIEALEDKIASTEDKEERKKLHEQLRLARRQSKHEKADEREENKAEREATQIANQAARENATGLTEAAKVQAAERRQQVKEEIEGLTAARKAERRADEDAPERINRSYELSHTRARGLDLEHMQGIVALQKAGFSLSQIGTARDVYAALKKVNGGKPLTEEEKLRENWAKEDRTRAFRRDQEDKDEALRHREEQLRGEGTADAGMMLAQAKSQGAWGKGARISQMQADAQAQIARLQAVRSGEAGEFEYSNPSSAATNNAAQRVVLPHPKSRRSPDGSITLYQEAWEKEIPLSRSDMDARSFQ